MEVDSWEKSRFSIIMLDYQRGPVFFCFQSDWATVWKAIANNLFAGGA
jgi:hypothetical protein